MITVKVHFHEAMQHHLLAFTLQGCSQYTTTESALIIKSNL
jgi:hypothetical protein